MRYGLVPVWARKSGPGTGAAAMGHMSPPSAGSGPRAEHTRHRGLSPAPEQDTVCPAVWSGGWTGSDQAVPAGTLTSPAAHGDMEWPGPNPLLVSGSCHNKSP